MLVARCLRRDVLLRAVTTLAGSEVKIESRDDGSMDVLGASELNQKLTQSIWVGPKIDCVICGLMIQFNAR